MNEKGGKGGQMTFIALRICAMQPCRKNSKHGILTQNMLICSSIFA